MVERIRQIMEFKGYSSTQFADTIEVPRAVISHIISGRNKPSLDVVIKIVLAFPEVSKEWILLGDGEMLNTLAAKASPELYDNLPIDSGEEAPEIKEEKRVEPEKVQSSVAPEIPAQNPEAAGKSIEQIVVFYSDKTFIAYKP